MSHHFTGIILCGGKSTRMGQNKALISIKGIPIIERIRTLFERLFKEVIIVSDQRELFLNLGAKIYPDLIPDRGGLGGLYTGLFFSSFPFSFSVGCDMPFLKESVIQFLLRNIDDFDVVVPRTRDGLQPLHAVYSKNCLEPIKRLIDSGNCRIADVYPMVRVKIIDEDDFSSLDPMRQSFINVNTPEELLLIKKMTQSC
jgi:molybdopterin-guanine dinucleotide biosynthesis protein A